MSKDALLTTLTREMERVAKNSENWVERMHAVNEMQKAFEGLDATAASTVGADVWRVLKPLKGMVQDLRSQIVKEVCNLLTTISRSTGDAMVPFLREILPALVDVRGSGNKVCGSYCAECIDACVSYTVVKGPTLKFFVDTLLESKNKLIRLCCITVVKLVLVHWSAVVDKTDVQQIERALKLALQDPSSSCRSQSYEVFTVFQQKFPKRAASVMSTVDYKIQKRLESMINGESTSRRHSLGEIPLGSLSRRSITSDSASVDDIPGQIDEASGPALETGDRVCIPDKELFGFVRFVGDIEGVKGKWIGVELDAPHGKNDGSVKGRYYFRCKPKYGVFARPHQVFLTISGPKLAEQQEKHPDFNHMTHEQSFQEDPSEDIAVESVLNLEFTSLELSPGPNSAAPTSPVEPGPDSNDPLEPTALHLVLSKASVAHRKYLDRLLQLVRAELEEHQRFDTFMATASSADAVQYLQQLQNAAQDKIVLSDRFIQHMIQAQQAARES
ncbi:hypothetical protein Poli38472_013409 [Pythium oligandrum]|uniref:CAP-Gly domain-containing protein n=1 Tax=Pythium oligandrum TaxID=41045 RepID=A0A8K1C7Y7_PYTOL|nr:hypothetical protein Poli38472_013409 [Pythium oligandrum]|eukprot:TMW57935.1 hypothetical protein Poli38472_013409 [Pythium oligandrum]